MKEILLRDFSPWNDAASSAHAYRTIYSVNGRSYEVTCRVRVVNAAALPQYVVLSYAVRRWYGERGWVTVISDGREYDPPLLLEWKGNTQDTCEGHLLSLAVRIADGG